MKALDSSLELRILVPRYVDHTFQRYYAERHPSLSSKEVVTSKWFLAGSNMTYLLDPLRISELLRSFCPNIILIEEDPHSLIGIEVSTLALFVRPKAKIVFFIWDNLARRPKFPLGFVKRRLTRYTLSLAALVICGNSEAQTLLKGAKGWRGPSTVLPQVGVDGPESFEERKGSAAPSIAYLGRLVPEKGIALLLAALFKLQHLAWNLVIIGSGPLSQEIGSVWQSAFGDRLTLENAVPHAQVAAYLKNVDIFVLPSYGTPQWKEQFGLTLAQAMIAGAACIGSSSGAIPEVLDETGLIFEEGNVESLVAALRSLLESPDKRRALGRAARRRALSEYSTEVVAARYLSALTGLL